MQELTTTLVVNGRQIARTAPGHFTLLRWLRDLAGIYDVKYGCGEGICGACTVLVDGMAVSSCLVLAARLNGRLIETVSGLLINGALDELQQAFLDHGAAQCGFCTPGMILAARELLDSGKLLDREIIREGLHGNLCRCTGYQAIVEAVEAAVRNHMPTSPNSDPFRAKGSPNLPASMPVNESAASGGQSE
jgi:carbon-monoxide dehydrogenase small subunit